MANSDLKKLVNTTCNALKDRNIPILTEVYDGQWQNFVMTDSENFPLTRMHLQNNLDLHKQIDQNTCHPRNDEHMPCTYQRQGKTFNYLYF